ncbi:MAG: RNA-binding protein [Chloroflexi bacterium]|jgi:DNA-directed RNA polymerase subunit RPC12/RpoP|nr:RNA-binding protein [Chloroflexota bacterium]MBT7289942.1 RNA-binding protein [Chloroflexota bacterium]
MHANHNQSQEHTCKCPFCDHKIDDSCSALCGGCGTTIYVCTSCNKPFNKDKGECPSCGTKVQ